MALVPKIDPNKIFASNAPSQDKPAAFDNYEKGMDETRKNLGRPTIPQLNYLHQTADQKILWIHQNGGGLPYDASIEYAENAVTLKDGELKQLVDGAWVETKTKATSITTASAQNQQQINDFGGAKWYAKVGGYQLGATVKLANGDTVKSTVANNIVDPNVDMTGWVKTNDASQIFDANGQDQQEINTALNRKTLHVIDFGAIGDGAVHPLSSKYATLQEAQAAFPLATITNLKQTIDYAAINQGIAWLSQNGGGELRADGGHHYVATDDGILSSITESQGQIIQNKSNVTFIGGTSVFENFIPHIMNADNSYYVGGEFRDTLMPAVKKRFGLRLQSSKFAGWRGTKHTRLNNDINNTLGFIYSYLENINDQWVETGSNRANEDIEFSDMFISGYGQFQQIGGKRFRYRNIEYDFYAGEPDDAICLKTYRFSNGRGSGEIDDVECTNIRVKGMSGILTIGGAVYKDFPIHNVRVNGGFVKDCRYVALLKNGGDTTANPSSDSYGGAVYDIQINNIGVDSAILRSPLGLWASFGGVIRDVSMTNITGSARSNGWNGFNCVSLITIHDYHVNEHDLQNKIQNIKMLNVSLNSENVTTQLNGNYPIGATISMLDATKSKTSIQDVFLDDIDLTGVGNWGQNTTYTEDQNVKMGKVDIKLTETPSVGSLSTYRFLGQNIPIDKLTVDMNQNTLQTFSQLVWGRYVDANFFGLKSFKIDIAATNEGGSYDAVWLAPEDMYLCQITAIKANSLSLNAVNYLTFRLERNSLSGSYIDIWSNGNDTLGTLTPKKIFQESSIGNAAQRIYFKKGERMRLRVVPTGTVQQQKTISLMFEYLPVSIKNYSFEA